MLNIPEDIHEHGRKAIEYEIPWLVSGAVHLLDQLLTEDMRVLEFGSGGSTLFFSKRVKSVLSYESSLKWFLKMAETLGTKGNCENVEIVFHTKEELEKDFPDGPFDCILIDNVITRRRTSVERGWLLKKSLPLLAGPKILVLDNYQVIHSDRATRELLTEVYKSRYRKRTYNCPGWKGGGTRVFYGK